MALKRLTTLFLAIELREAATTTGTYQNQTGKMLPIDPYVEFDVGRYARVVNSKTLTAKQGLGGVRTGRVTFGLELTASNGPNQFQDTIRCAGFADEAVGKFTIGAVTGGPFRHGETITQASSGASGLCVGDVWNTMPLLWVAQDFQFGSGTFDATGVLIGSSSGASVTPSAYVAAGGRAWWPYSYRTSILQFDGAGLLSNVTAGQQIRGVTSRAVGTVFFSQTAGIGQQVMFERQFAHFASSEVVENLTTGNANIGTTSAAGFEVQIRNCTASIGLVKDVIRERIDWARGNVKLSGKIGEPAILDFAFLGAMRETVDQGTSLHPDLSQILVPPILLGTDFLIGPADAGQASLKRGCIRAFTLDMGHDVQIQECMALTANHGPFFGAPHDDFTPRGVDMAIIVGRKPVLTIDPLLEPETAFPWIDSYMNNRSLRAQMTIGTTPPNKFYISMSSMSVVSAPTGEYSGISTRNVTLELDGGNARGARADNEIVIIEEFA